MVLRSLLVLLASATLAIGMPVKADPWKDESGHGYRGGKHNGKHGKHHRKHKGKHRHERDYYEVEYDSREGYRRGGPPPWAPAHGYRRGHDRDHEYRDHEYRDREYRDRDYREPQPRVTIHVEPEPKVHATTEVDFEADSQRIGIDSGKCDRKVVGAVVGGLVGGIIGNKTTSGKNRKLGTLAGALIGAVVGSEIGRNMDNTDAQCTNQALERAPDGRAVTWDNPNTGHKYSVTPTDTYKRDDGTYCRNFKTTVKAQAGTQNYNDTACRNDQGVWERRS